MLCDKQVIKCTKIFFSCFKMLTIFNEGKNMKVEKNRVAKNNEYCRQLYIVLQLMQNQESKNSIKVIFPPK